MQMNFRQPAAAILCALSCAILSAADARVSFEQIPLVFEPNRGQTNSAARFFTRGDGFAVFFENREALLKLPGSTLRFRWQGSNPGEPRAEASTGGVSHYLIGASKQGWHTGIPHYARIRYPDLYPGIDLVYYGRGRQLEYDLIVAPRADLGSIALDAAGAAEVRIEDGELVLATAAGELRHRRPVAWQEIAGVRRPVDIRYRLDHHRHVRFDAEPYDRAYPLVIDPVLRFGRAIGGSGVDRINAVSGGYEYVYVAGETMSADYPVANGGQNSLAGNSDGFVMKLTSDGSHIAFSTFLGGYGSDRITAMSGLCLAGETTSFNFPAFAPMRTRLSGPSDAFAACLDPDGRYLTVSGLFGGSGQDTANAIHGSYDSFWIGGKTNSPDLPKTVAGSSLSGPSDGFLMRANSDGLSWSRYVGGSGEDEVFGVAFAYTNNKPVVFTAGETTSTNLTGRSWQTASGGGSDAFVAGYDWFGAPDFWAYLGGSGNDGARAMQLDSQSKYIFIAGHTSSNNFPVKYPLQSAYGGGTSDAFFAVLSTSGNSLFNSSYLGGSGDDRAWALQHDGNILIAGETRSADFPQRGAILKATPPGDTPDAFVTRVHDMGDLLAFSTRLGGSGPDIARAVTASGESVFVGGSTSSADLPVTFGPAPQGQDGFLYRLDSSCALTLDGNLYFPSTGGTRTLSIQIGTECPWTMRWYYDNSVVNYGVGPKSFPLTLPANNGPQWSADLRVNDKSFSVSQAQYTGTCTLTFDTASLNRVAATGISKSMTVTQWHCGCEASTSTPWITVSPSCEGGVLNYQIGFNPSRLPRTGSITVSGHNLPVYQLPSGPGPAQFVGVYSGDGVWRIDANRDFSPSTAGDRIFQWGSTGSKPVLGDWNNDGHTEVGAFDKGVWYLDVNGDLALNAGDHIFAWGNANSIPIPGDWNGDGITDAGVWENGAWILDLNGNRQLDPGEIFAWGPADGIPMVGDWNGDRRTKVASYKDGVWIIDVDGDRVYTKGVDPYFQFGTAGMQPVVGDWNGDGRMKVGVMKDGVWIQDFNGDGRFTSADKHFHYGGAGSVPVLGDWNNDGATDVGIYENVTGYGIFTLDHNADRQYSYHLDKRFIFGKPTDTPLVGRW